MRAFGETAFDIVYLITVITLGIRMFPSEKKQYKLFGIMAVILGCGDAFHLIPRAWALCTTGLQDFPAALGIGKMVTSITMTVFYVILFYVWHLRYEEGAKKGLTVAVWLLAAARIGLCLFPQNRWITNDSPLSWGIYRNIPFAILGAVIIVLYLQSAARHGDKAFRLMWLAVTLSFGFYIPVVLWAEAVPIIGMLMIPKTCAYVWIVVMGYRAMKKE